MFSLKSMCSGRGARYRFPRASATIFILLILLVPVAMATAQAFPGVADGSHIGEAMGYYDVFEVEVVVEKGTIKSIEVLFAQDSDGVWQYAVDQLLPQIIETQSVDVDAISGATKSSIGFINAVRAALGFDPLSE
jgi:uncharacterized protein with FMN-binding domain